MSQRITEDVAMSLKKGDILYHNIIVFTGEGGEEIPATAVVTGKMVKGSRYEGFSLPIKRQYGDKGESAVTRFSQDLWRTTPEKIKEARVRRTRSATVDHIPEHSEPEPRRVSRVRRTEVSEKPAERVRRTRAAPAVEEKPVSRVRRTR